MQLMGENQFVYFGKEFGNIFQASKKCLWPRYQVGCFWMEQRILIQTGLSKGKYVISHNGKARERQVSGWPKVLSVSVLCCPQKHWLHPWAGPSQGGGVLRDGGGGLRKRQREES